MHETLAKCWMILKSRRPDLWPEMTQIELLMMGLSVPDEKPGGEQEPPKEVDGIDPL